MDICPLYWVFVHLSIGRCYHGFNHRTQPRFFPTKTCPESA